MSAAVGHNQVNWSFKTLTCLKDQHKNAVKILNILLPSLTLCRNIITLRLSPWSLKSVKQAWSRFLSAYHLRPCQYRNILHAYISGHFAKI